MHIVHYMDFYQEIPDTSPTVGFGASYFNSVERALTAGKSKRSASISYRDFK